VAANCAVLPAATEAVVGLIEIEVNTAAVTVKVAEPLTVPDEAVIAVEPCAIAVARPPLTLATAKAEEFQLAVLVRFWVVPLL
jgi:hypothetical protein